PDLPNIRSWDDVIGHKEAINLWPSVGSTACPGNRWKEGMNMYNRMRFGPGWGGALPEQGGSTDVTPEQDFSNCFITVATRWPSKEEVDAWKASGLAPYDWVQKFGPSPMRDELKMEAFRACWITQATIWPTREQEEAWIKSGISAYEFTQKNAPNPLRDAKEEEIRRLHLKLEQYENEGGPDQEIGRKLRELIRSASA
ncbi:MAG: hypothetical protein M3Q03_01395, partial [Chloroflexota bacterium]|nr:hypothetical protein [Chloroflexota bacterium]